MPKLNENYQKLKKAIFFPKLRTGLLHMENHTRTSH